jgi:hypothetical protein
MIDRYQNIARAFLAVLWLAMGGGDEAEIILDEARKRPRRRRSENRG